MFDLIFTVADTITEEFLKSAVPGAHLVDAFPICTADAAREGPETDFSLIVKYVPEWFPGAGFQRLAAGWRRSMYNARDGPFDEAKNSYVSDIFLFLPYHSDRSL